MVELYLSLGFFCGFILLGLVVGGLNERRHYASILRREDELSDMLVTQTKDFPRRSTSPASAPLSDAPQAAFVVAEVVIATDYLKSFLAMLRNIFGGRVHSYQTLLDRARREATLRILEQARSQGYNAVCNVRLASADIAGNATARKTAMAAILAWGTAYHATRPPTA